MKFDVVSPSSISVWPKVLQPIYGRSVGLLIDITSDQPLNRMTTPIMECCGSLTIYRRPLKL